MNLEATKSTAIRTMLNKVPEVTIWFWIIKIMATTVGETAADFLNETMKLGLTTTTVVMTVGLLAVLWFQFKARQYVPGLYWLAVVFISVAIVLAITFAVWQKSEGTLSIHSIYTTKREAFYWLTILFTFALGTAAGDLIAEQFNIGYWKSGLIFGGCIALVVLAWRLGANPILTFWAAYILTRPLGASIGDYLSQKPADGGLGLGTVGTSALFLSTILVVVLYLTRTKKDQVVVTLPA
jgi:uncharacterized membrane-anchored protein